MKVENSKERDPLKSLFSRLPGGELPAGFRESVMQKVLAEAVRIRKRNERVTLLLLILASAGIVALSVVSILYLQIPGISWGMPAVDWRMPDLPSIPFYFYIGVLCLLLLGGDFLFRRAYRKHHEVKD